MKQDNKILLNLISAEEKATKLFFEIQERQLIVPGKSEHQLNNEIFELAFELFSIR
jgi:hypothetical protein